MSSSRLSPAYHGYSHQDVVTAYALASLLLPQSEARVVAVEHKVVAHDRFDDLELRGTLRIRVQIKAHQGEARPLRLSDFTTEGNLVPDRRCSAIIFRKNSNPADAYRLLTTYGLPDDSLVSSIKEDGSASPLLPGLRTRLFRLDIERIWPAGQPPSWPYVDRVGRERLALFCERFVIEIRCPQSSADLRAQVAWRMHCLMSYMIK